MNTLRIKTPFLLVSLLILGGCSGRRLLRPYLELPPDPDSERAPILHVQSHRSPYMEETEGILLVRVKEGLGHRPFRFKAKVGDQTLFGRAYSGERVRVPFDLTVLPWGVTQAFCELLPPEGIFRGKEQDRALASLQAPIRREPFRSNAVQIDLETHGLLVDGLPFFPVGFYCRHPLRDLPEVEAAKGFNHIVPFDYASKPVHENPKGHSESQLEVIKQTLDRCAELGIKAHYDIKVIAQVLPSEQKWEELRREIELFKDHPALLGWYICDEPSGWGVPEETLEETYRFVKEVDPYHPVTIVFDKPKPALGYKDALDILVADPYPIPHLPVTTVSDWMEILNQGLFGQIPIWIVPQAFGGGEWWPREPSAQEERIMTYLALIHGAKGIQYFIRVPPMGHPKSPRLWAECGRLAQEIAELTPFLLSPDRHPDIRCEPDSLHASAWRHQGHVLVLAANTQNRPQTLKLRLRQDRYTGPVSCLFENRLVDARRGRIKEPVEAFGTRAYIFPLEPRRESHFIHPKNLTHNPSFEEFSNVGTPDGCYFFMGKEDWGSTGFLDPRVSLHGSHSLRLTTAKEGQGIRIRPYRMEMKEGQTYKLVLWAKALRPNSRFEIQFEGLGIPSRVFEIGTEWDAYTLTGQANRSGRHHMTLVLQSQGTAWIDLLQVYPVE